MIWPELMRPDERDQERASRLGDAGLMMQLTYLPTVRLRKTCEFLLHRARLPLSHLMLHQTATVPSDASSGRQGDASIKRLQGVHWG